MAGKGKKKSSPKKSDTAMASYAPRMKHLANVSRVARSLRRHLRQQSPRAIMEELLRYNLSIVGDDQEKVERLLRFAVRAAEPDQDVPWYPELDHMPGCEPEPIDRNWLLAICAEVTAIKEAEKKIDERASTSKDIEIVDERLNLPAGASPDSSSFTPRFNETSVTIPSTTFVNVTSSSTSTTTTPAGPSSAATSNQTMVTFTQQPLMTDRLVDRRFEGMRFTVANEVRTVITDGTDEQLHLLHRFMQSNCRAESREPTLNVPRPLSTRNSVPSDSEDETSLHETPKRPSLVAYNESDTESDEFERISDLRRGPSRIQEREPPQNFIRNKKNEKRSTKSKRKGIKYRDRRTGAEILSEGSSESSSDNNSSDEETASSQRNGMRQTHKSRAEPIKILQSWVRKFSGKDKDDPNDFLARLKDCKESTKLSDTEILSAVPCVLDGMASLWYRTVRKDINSWRQFKRAFKRQYIDEMDHEDIYDELRERRQGKGEKIKDFILCFKHIVSYFKHPPSMEKQIEIALRNLRPEYRSYMIDHYLESFEVMEKYGRRFERQRDIDSRYAPPPVKDKARIPVAAYLTNKTSVGKVSAVKEKNKKFSESSESESSEKQFKPKGVNLNKENSKNVKKGKQSGKIAAVAEPEKVEAFVQVQQPRAPQQKTQGAWQPAVATQPAQPPPSQQVARPTYAAVASNNRGSMQTQQAPRRSFNKNVFSGPCYECQTNGHRASECPQRRCYNCQQVGHYASSCPWRQTSESCQVCKTPNTTFDVCIKCAPFRIQLGNESAGAQIRPLAPAFPLTN